MERLSAVALGGSPGSLDGCCAAALAQVWKSSRFVYYVYSSLVEQGHTDVNLQGVFHTLCAGKMYIWHRRHLVSAAALQNDCTKEVRVMQQNTTGYD